MSLTPMRRWVWTLAAIEVAMRGGSHDVFGGMRDLVELRERVEGWLVDDYGIEEGTDLVAFLDALEAGEQAELAACLRKKPVRGTPRKRSTIVRAIAHDHRDAFEAGALLAAQAGRRVWLAGLACVASRISQERAWRIAMRDADGLAARFTSWAELGHHATIGSLFIDGDYDRDRERAYLRLATDPASPYQTSPWPTWRTDARRLPALRLRVRCPRCEHLTPVSEIAAEPVCEGCLRPVPLGARRIEDLVAEGVESALGLPIDADDAVFGHDHDVVYHLDVAWRRPLCVGCGAWLSGEVARGALANDAPVACAACDGHLRARPLRGMVERIGRGGWLVGEVAGPDAERRGSRVDEAVVIACDTCGASLPVTTLQREIGCRYCHADNRVPAAIWERLQPPTESRWLYWVMSDDER